MLISNTAHIVQSREDNEKEGEEGGGGGEVKGRGGKGVIVRGEALKTYTHQETKNRENSAFPDRWKTKGMSLHTDPCHYPSHYQEKVSRPWQRKGEAGQSLAVSLC